MSVSKRSNSTALIIQRSYRGFVRLTFPNEPRAPPHHRTGPALGASAPFGVLGGRPSGMLHDQPRMPCVSGSTNFWAAGELRTGERLSLVVDKSPLIEGDAQFRKVLLEVVVAAE